MKNLALGSCIGSCVGDAAGTVVERLGRAVTAADVKRCLDFPGGGFLRVAPGQVTDDGEMTVSLSGALLQWITDAESDRDNLPPPDEMMATHYAKWAASDPFDMGITIGASIGIAMRSNPHLEAQVKAGRLAETMRSAALHTLEGRTSEANGSLMRCTPLALVGYRLSDLEIFELCVSDSSLSHPNLVCSASVGAYVIAIVELLQGGSARAAYHRAMAALEQQRDVWSEAAEKVLEWLQIADSRTGVSFEGGHVKIGLIYAFRCLLYAPDFKTAVEQTILGGGDTDTNAAIVGGLMGARVGLDGIPLAYRQSVLECDVKRGRYRPDFLHPKLLLERIPVLLENAPAILPCYVGPDVQWNECLGKVQAPAFSEIDMSREDESNDASFFQTPIFSYHISNAARCSLFHYLRAELSGDVLDLGSSWTSHTNGIFRRIFGIGLSEDEMRLNSSLGLGFKVQNLNSDPVISFGDQRTFDHCICSVSFQYLLHPVATFSSVSRCMKTGGRVHVILSNRYWPAKAIKWWTQASYENRLAYVAHTLREAGFSNVTASLITRPIWIDEENHHLWCVRGTLPNYM